MPRSARLDGEHERPGLARLRHVEEHALAPVPADGRRLGAGQREPHRPEPGLRLDDDADGLLQAAVPMSQQRQVAGTHDEPGQCELDAADAAAQLLARAVLDVALGQRNAAGARRRSRPRRRRHRDRHARPVESTRPRSR